ncbi:PHD and/or Treacle domain containing protein [Asbolus verrucosus]|uniref:PHD and/or Treacle domain containing protein n=1 Tax=Asbolus verrucosus TaxID=1661398 RepID=A0A482W562_ASBVE|nr:PHD and/or Treacle domain containing protein [Asbolus verrucosus]
MEDGLNGILSETEAPDHINNGVVSPIMANFSEPEETATKEDPVNKVNGDTEQISNPEEYSSESDALIIDESAPAKKKRPNSPKTSEIIPHFNPYFNESLFELSQQHQPDNLPKPGAPPAKYHKHKRLKNKNSPKLREYAQYLGLQPTVQFKCSRCGRAGFESLTTLNEHIVQCTDEPTAQPQIQENSSSSFKLTRKVFLCSACGTYYENWNLYLHMIEVHRRYLCLYCLGMFSVLDDLCLHIQSRHNLEPGHKESLDDFFSAYTEPCYIVCCECNKLFNEQDNFFYHSCACREAKSNKINNQKANNKLLSKSIKQQIRPEDHVTGDTLVNGDCLNLENIRQEGHDEEPSNNLTIAETKDTDRLTDEAVIEDDKVEEIVYSTDDELDFRGFSEAGEPVFVNNDKIDCPEPVELPQEVMEEGMEIEEPVETRKVPKLSLKLKPGSFPQIEQHDEVDKLETEQIESESDLAEPPAVTTEEPQIKIAGPDIGIIELQLEQPLDKFDIRVLLQKCLKATAPFCIYCNHARKIAVNGQQLGLHAIGEHRFSAVVSSITAEELIPESFVARIKESLPDLGDVFFSLESSPSDEAVTFSHIFECFQCRYSTTVHKELYLHNRKSHAKNLLLCIMCKSNFYSYSELICHLCPGVYILDYDVGFRCCMCVGDDLPSAFRLMVHLRKRHHVCDVCLEMCHNQYRLSNHVWKHKLHHFCYRCGIAYRNKPDITRHLFWKHGTESVLCKKCLQKKWPHVYHFCVPPVNFVCEECNLTFSRAVSLKVHKRIHSEEKPHACTIDDCQERFISKKLLAKHESKHREPPEEAKVETGEEEPKETTIKTEEDKEGENKEEKVEEKEKVKPKVDVYDLPELNLSESDSSESEEEAEKPKREVEEVKEKEIEEVVIENEETVALAEDPGTESGGVVLENIWDDFKNYQANKEKFDHMFVEADKHEQPQEAAVEAANEPLTLEMALKDHDYCIDPDNKPDVSFTEVKPDLSQSVDHDYCSAKDPVTSPKDPEVKVVEEEKMQKKASSSSDSSSDSDSSSCSCGPNCSCSSSSGSSSSSSDSSDSDSSTEEGRKRQQLRRDRRRQRKNKGKEGEKVAKVDVVAGDNQVIPEIPILESDLETTESETDEEFYDKQPQKLAKKILEEKRNQLLAGIEQAPNGSFLESSRAATPNLPEEEEQIKPKKKSKSKKKKKKKSERREAKEFDSTNIPAPYYQYYQPPTVAPITLSLARNSPVPSPSAKLPSTNVFPKSEAELPREDGDVNLRASKRRRVPNKFYGYSSDEEEEKMATGSKWRKTEAAAVPPMVPPITIKAGPPPAQPFRAVKEAQPSRKMPPIKLKTKMEDGESEVESNDSSNEGRNMLQVNPDALYCYCKCPYDEVSEMIGCDARDCSIEWFHFECVGIMVPPKGHWYCPECRKKRQQKRETLKLKTKTS